jgi:hypothetical protein
VTSRHAWTEAVPEIIGAQGTRAASPWDALSLVSRIPAGDRFSILPDEVDLSVSLGDGDRRVKADLPIVLTDNSDGLLSPHARLALVQACHRRGCILRLEDPTPDLVDLAGELGVALWVVLGPRRTEATVEALQAASVVEMSLSSLGPDGELEVSVDARDGSGSMANSVEVLRSVAHGAPVVLDAGLTVEMELLRQAAQSGADAIMVQALSRSSRMHHGLVGPGTMASVAATRRAVSRSKVPEGSVKPRVVASGGFKDGLEVAKSLALGADVVVMGTAPRIAMGCTLCGDCGPGECPTRSKKGKADWKAEADGLVAFVDRVTSQLRSAMAQAGVMRGGDASIQHLEATDYDTAAVTGASLAGYGEVLPMWRH